MVKCFSMLNRISELGFAFLVKCDCAPKTVTFAPRYENYYFYPFDIPTIEGLVNAFVACFEELMKNNLDQLLRPGCLIAWIKRIL